MLKILMIFTFLYKRAEIFKNIIYENIFDFYMFMKRGEIS